MNLPYRKQGTLDMQTHSSSQGHHPASLTCSLKTEKELKIINSKQTSLMRFKIKENVILKMSLSY